MTIYNTIQQNANIIRATPLVQRAVLDILQGLIDSHTVKFEQAKDILVHNESARPSALKETGALAALREVQEIIGRVA